MLKVSPAPLPFQGPVLQVYLILSGTANQLTLQCCNYFSFQTSLLVDTEAVLLKGNMQRLKMSALTTVTTLKILMLKLNTFIYICPFL